jgi:hypothetical protein
MKSISDLKSSYKLTNEQLLIALRNCVSYYLSEDELKVFIKKAKSVTTKKNNNRSCLKPKHL